MEKRVGFNWGKSLLMFKNPVSQRKSDQKLLKCFCRKCATSFTTEAAKDN